MHKAGTPTPQPVRTAIANAEDLAKIGVDPDYPLDGAYYLDADIPLTGWTPIAADTLTDGYLTTTPPNTAEDYRYFDSIFFDREKTPGFSGIFDGNGHTITLSSFKAEVASFSKYLGIFAVVKGTKTTKAEFRNLTIRANVNVESAAFNQNIGQSVGLLAGFAAWADFSDITVEGNLTFKSLKGLYVGGIAGSAYDGFAIYYRGRIHDSSSTGNITAKAKYFWPYAGGICGYICGNGKAAGFYDTEHRTRIVRCWASGTIGGEGTGKINMRWPYAGGIVGYNYEGAPVSRCVFKNGKVVTLNKPTGDLKTGTTPAAASSINDYAGGHRGLQLQKAGA